MIDIDFFKKINDTYGHQIGDETLKTVVKVIQENMRTSDILGRWGGEEFMVICPNTNTKGALVVAQAIRKAIEKAYYICWYIRYANKSKHNNTYKPCRSSPLPSKREWKKSSKIFINTRI